MENQAPLDLMVTIDEITCLKVALIDQLLKIQTIQKPDSYLEGQMEIIQTLLKKLEAAR